MKSNQGYRPRPVTDAEFLSAFTDIIARLDRHIALIDAADYVLRNDLACVIRILLGKDKGNQALVRFASRFRQDEPTILCSQEPGAPPDMLLGVGAIPILTTNEGPVTQRLSSFLSLKALAVQTSSGVRQFTWQSIVDDYGNSFGAHLTGGVPQVLDLLKHAGMGSVDFGTYILRTLGVACSRRAHDMLLQGGFPTVKPNHPDYSHGTEITHLLYLRTGGKDDLRAAVRMENWSKAQTLCTVVTPDGRKLIFGVADGGKLSLSVN